MRVPVYWFVFVVFLTSAAMAQQTIYFKKDHIYAGPGGKEIAIVTPLPLDQIAPTAPLNLSSSNITSTSVQLSWSASTDTGGSGLAGYKLYRQRGTGARLPVGTVGTSTLSFTDRPLQPATAYTYTVVAFDKDQNHSAASNAVNITTINDGSVPANLVATASSTTQVNLSWTASTGAVSYQIERSSNLASYTQIGTSTTTAYNDTSVSSGITYLYRVRGVDASNNMSPYSNVDLATTILFTDDPLIAGVTVVKAQHFTELRSAVNAVRAAAGLAAASWTDSSLSGVVIKVVHLQELRDNLNPALTMLGFSPPAYTDPTLTPRVTVIKKAHVNELRQSMK